MFVKKLIYSLSKLFSIYEALTEIFLDETDVYSYFITIFVTFLNLITGWFESVEDPTKKIRYQIIPILRYKNPALNLLPGKQLFINVPIQSTKHRKKETSNLCVDSVPEIIGEVYCPTLKKM